MGYSGDRERKDFARPCHGGRRRAAVATALRLQLRKFRSHLGSVEDSTVVFITRRRVDVVAICGRRVAVFAAVGGRQISTKHLNLLSKF
jgi:hypothetical protein